jgi:hypothetical protein
LVRFDPLFPEFHNPWRQLRGYFTRGLIQVIITGQIAHFSEHARKWPPVNNIMFYLEVKASFATIPEKREI